MHSLTLYASLFFLFGSSCITSVSTALRRLGRLQAEEELKKERSLFFFRYFLKFFFGSQKWEGLFFSLSFTKHLLRMGFILSAFFYLLKQKTTFASLKSTSTEGNFFEVSGLFSIVLIIVATSLIVDFLFHFFGQIKPTRALNTLSSWASLMLLICIPITAPFFQLIKFFLPQIERQKKTTPTFRIRDKVYELLKETELDTHLDSNEKKLILSVVSFKERIAREVMVPRINVFSLSMDTLIHEAAESFLLEGYSRIPIYKESVDNIVGVLLYKDILNIYIDQKIGSQKLQQTIEKHIKPVLYAPETKKISHLLQEFRNKHIHLAIIVDEYGGTEGIVTIEDILEELVGEISDEYDVGQQSLFTPLATGGWIIDAKMSIIDIQEELGIKIPLSAEYDTVGGYVFHRAGAIPSKGWKIHHDDFDLEVISSNERSLNKIKIIPH